MKCWKVKSWLYGVCFLGAMAVAAQAWAQESAKDTRVNAVQTAQASLATQEQPSSSTDSSVSSSASASPASASALPASSAAPAATEAKGSASSAAASSPTSTSTSTLASTSTLTSTVSASPAATAPASFAAAPLETQAKQAILVDATTGDVLFAKDADAPMATSSMSKVLTMYLVFEAIRDGKLKLTDLLTVSEHAWKQEGSRMFVKVGDKVAVQDLIQGVIVQSGNDAAVVLAEALGGSEDQFADMMNAKAQQLGMKHSHFKNATGIPDPAHYSTARDLATLALAMMRDFPQDYHYYSEQEFTYNGIKQGNRNPLLYRNIGVDGLKTGHTEVAGFGLIASALRDGRRLIAVVNGLPSMQARADEPAKVLDWGYREYGLYPVLKKGQDVAKATVWLGDRPDVSISVGQDLTVSMPKAARAGLQVTLAYNQPMTVPIKAGQTVGKALVDIPGREIVELPLVASADVGEVGFFQKLAAKLGLLLGMH